MGENYFTWLNNYGFFPKVTEIEIEYVFDNVKSVENLEVQVGVVRMMPKLVAMTGLGVLCILNWKGVFTYEA